MKLIINTVNIRIGGAFQRALSFVKELKEIGTDEYHIFHTEEFSEQIDIASYPDNFRFYVFPDTTASLKQRSKIIKEFNKIQAAVNPDVVFSFVGPAYWRAKSPHLVGYAVPHMVYNDFDYFKRIGLKTKLEMFYKWRWTKYEADYYVAQTEDVVNRLSARLNNPIKKVFLVSNGPGKQYDNVKVVEADFDSPVRKLLMISTFRPSKNFDIIRKVVPLLKDDIFKYEFHITIEEEIYKNLFKGFESHVINHGHVKAVEGPHLYNSCHAMFLPSHLECFSASYPEAMKMERPILTSDLPFAHTVCGDAAIYFDNLNEADIAHSIKKLFHTDKLYRSLVEKGKIRLKSFDTSRQQAEKYLSICREILTDTN